MPIPLLRAYWCENCQCFIETPEVCEVCADDSSIIPASNLVASIPKASYEVIPFEGKLIYKKVSQTI